MNRFKTGLGNTLVVDTKGICVLCLRPSDINDDDDKHQDVIGCEPSYLTIPNYSIKRLSRYLEIHLGKILIALRFPDDEVISRLIRRVDKQDDLDIKFALCPGCASVTEEFSELHEQLEKTQLLINHCLGKISGKVKIGEGRKEGLWRRMAGNQRDLSYSDLVEKFREETAEKCDLRLTQQRGPTVPIQKLTEAVINKYKPKPIIPDEEEDKTEEIRNDHIETDHDKLNCLIEMPKLERQVAHSKRFIEAVRRSLEACTTGGDDNDDPPPPILLPQVTLLHNRLRERNKKIGGAALTKLSNRGGSSSFSKLKTGKSGAPIPKSGSKLNSTSHPPRNNGLAINRRLPFPCKLCSKSFQSESSLLFHTDFEHNKRHQVNCHLCKKSFHSAYLLLQHQLQSHPKSAISNGNDHEILPPTVSSSSKPYRCTICTRRFDKIYGLRKHIAAVHEREALQRCL